MIPATNVTEKYSITVEEIPLVDRVIAGVLWILYEFPGNALMLGMVQFDRLGGDPLKRRITDQVSTCKTLVQIVSFCFNTSLFIYLAVFKLAPASDFQ